MSQFFLQKKMLMRFTHQHQKVYTPNLLLNSCAKNWIKFF